MRVIENAKRFRITHSTGYLYEGMVNASYNEVRVTPRSSVGQTVLDTRVTVEPQAYLYSYEDYWGTLVLAFDIQVPHNELRFTATSVVEVHPQVHGFSLADGDIPKLPGIAGAAIDVPTLAGWGALSDPAAADRWTEYLLPTELADADEAMVEISESLRNDGRSPMEAVQSTVEWVNRSLEYERGATNASTTATEALGRGKGVCQDFAHVTLALLRTMGIPSRYVSGYLHPNPSSRIGEAVVGESHAWIEAWLGEWIAFDPTSKAPVSDRHVVVATGRDYSDLPPMKGIFSGSKSSLPNVTVEIVQER